MLDTSQERRSRGLNTTKERSSEGGKRGARSRWIMCPDTRYQKQAPTLAGGGGGGGEEEERRRRGGGEEEEERLYLRLETRERVQTNEAKSKVTTGADRRS